MAAIEPCRERNPAQIISDLLIRALGGLVNTLLTLSADNLSQVWLGAREGAAYVMDGFMIARVRAQHALASVTMVATIALNPVQPFAAELPQIKLSSTNKVPACVTPGRLAAFLESRNGKLESRFSTISADYMRIGEELNIRWDVAFFQMLLETGSLKFGGDVAASQNNFAGLGATGRKAPGESFPDIATGVKAHMQHLLMYAGEKIENPVAERTRNIQEWGALTSWHQTLKGETTFAQIAKKWAPTSRRYTTDIENIAQAFYSGACLQDDPKPELMARGQPGTAKTFTVASAPTAKATNASGADLAARVVAEARTSGSFVRSSLGAGSLIPATGESEAVAPAGPQPEVKILNAVQPVPVAAPPIEPETDITASISKPAEKTIQLAVLGAGTKSSASAEPSTGKSAGKGPSSKCRVWTASYGGSRAVIIKAQAEQFDNYTVLDVNEGAEKRETDAYISAYAKDGVMVGEFGNPAQALDKAFELCPEG